VRLIHLTRTTEELWNCAIQALSELRGSDIGFSPWLVKGVQVHPSGRSASFTFLDAAARQKQIGIGLEGGSDRVMERIKGQLQALVPRN
jgi:hypothetical protein